MALAFLKGKVGLGGYGRVLVVRAPESGTPAQKASNGEMGPVRYWWGLREISISPGSQAKTRDTTVGGAGTGSCARTGKQQAQREGLDRTTKKHGSNPGFLEGD